MKIRGQEVLEPKNRIMSLVKVATSGCWEWQGAKKGKTALSNYGKIGVGSRKDGTRKTVSAHRYSYEIFIGDIPDGLWVLHKCDNPCCVNPDHLFLGDRNINTLDRDAKGRNKIMFGEMNGQSILTEKEVAAIRNEFNPRKITRKMLAVKYGVSEAAIKNIVVGSRWGFLIPAQPKRASDD